MFSKTNTLLNTYRIYVFYGNIQYNHFKTYYYLNLYFYKFLSHDINKI